jgi:hypothetical protein
MKRIVIALFVIATTISLIATTAHADGPTPTPTPTPTPAGFNPDAIVQGLSVAFLVSLLLTLVAGAVGGLVYELLTLQGNIEYPHQLTEKEVVEKFPYAIAGSLYDLGIWARVIIGALAAMIVMLVVSPSSTFSLLATAVVAGSAGSSIFRSMQDRLLASIAQKDAADTKAKADKQATKVEEAGEAFAELKNKLVTGLTSPAGTTALIPGAGSLPVTLDDLDKVGKLLIEAKVIHEAI